MELVSFGSILSFAAELESQGMSFYDTMIRNPLCEAFAEQLREFSKITQKNHKLLLRTRRENVTEMILEPVTDFTKAPFLIRFDLNELATKVDVLAKIRQMEEKLVRFHTEAAAKLTALPEVARVLKTVGKKHAAICRSLDAL
jgi:hypothetical protein